MREWIFSSNTFEANTRSSFKKFLTLDEDHWGKLAEAASGGDPDFVTLKNDYQPPAPGLLQTNTPFGRAHRGSTKAAPLI